MNAVLMTPEEKKVAVNTETDTCLYDAPRNPANTGTRYTRGSDFYAHTARSGKNYFYAYHWSMWQGDEDSFHLLTDEEMKARLIELNDGSRYSLSGSEIARAEKFFPGIFEEDA